MKTETSIVIKDWPVLPVKETNRQRIVRALREATVPQCFNAARDSGAHCGGIVAYHGTGGNKNESELVDLRLKRFGIRDGWMAFINLNDRERLTFREMADRLDSDDSYWNEHASEEFKP